MTKKKSLKGHDAGKKDSSPFVPQREKFGHDFKIRQRDDLTERQKEFLKLALDKDTKVIFLTGPAGTSKAQPLDSLILTPDGWRKMGDILPGSMVYSNDGIPTKVLSVHPQGVKDVYTVEFSDGTNTECTLDHLWHTQTYNDRTHKLSRNHKVRTKMPKDGSVKTTQEILDTLISAEKKSSPNHSIPITAPVIFSEKSHIIDSYNMGALLGDGCFKVTPSFTNIDTYILERFKSMLPKGLYLSNSNDSIDYRIVTETAGVGCNPYKNELKRMELWGRYSYEKFIPHEYLFDSVEHRIALLQGLLDTDGHASSNCAIFSSTSICLINDVRFLVESLGGIGFISQTIGKYKQNGIIKETRISYRLSIRLPNNICPFSLPRKIEKLSQRTKYLPIRYIKNISFVGRKECQCILIENDSHLYLTNNFIVTHNTFLSVLVGLELIQSHRISDMIYVRSVVESSDQKMGFLPGDMNEKVAPYMTPLLDKLDEFLDKGTIDKLLKEERITSKPIGFLRGLNWNARFIIADEAQNLTSKELITLMTRIGEFSKLFICGDSMQSDINGKSGFVDITKMFDSAAAREQGIHVFEFTEVDIVRSALVRFIVKTVNENSRYLTHKI